MDKLEEREKHIRHLELELAQRKLELVEAQCRNQDLSHQVRNTNFSNTNFNYYCILLFQKASSEQFL